MTIAILVLIVLLIGTIHVVLMMNVPIGTTAVATTAAVTTAQTVIAV